MSDSGDEDFEYYEEDNNNAAEDDFDETVDYDLNGNVKP